MVRAKCETCKKYFERNSTARRQQKFCSTQCRRISYDRVPNSTFGQIAKCARCGNSFEKKKNHQRFCSSNCYKGAWIVENRKKHNARISKRRIDKPEWYAEREPEYHKTYRAKLLSKYPWKYLLTSARNRAKEKNMNFDLDDEWAKARWTGCCEITGLQFRANGTRGPHPFSPSVDRKNANEGYTKENTRFVLWGCNAIKGVGTDTDMFEIVHALARVAPSTSRRDL